MKKLEEYVRCIPDFPEEGVMFRDVTSVLQDAEGLNPEDSFSVPPLLIITINPLF